MTRFDDHGVPYLDSYVFGEHLATQRCLSAKSVTVTLFSEENNPFLHEGASSSLFDSAKRLMASNGCLDEATLLIEASIQKGELGEGGYEAWLLGRTRSMDEREAQALPKSITRRLSHSRT